MRKIKLTKDQFTLVDDEDYKYLSSFKWYYGNTGYAVSTNKSLGLTTYMHRFLVGAHNGEIVDHININRLDNRRSNLRIVSASENTYNSKLSSRNKTGHRGVSFDKNRNKYRVNIQFKGKWIFLGRYVYLKDAILAYNDAAKKYYKSFALLNEEIK